ncbi:centrosomal protein 15 isoform X2 [Trichomycterus rosablanca]|uniref:centrosomal protein 15 isoform X2 n=1 Tax=Trichomycterus rosablanca TaxID=2290929 RepID=UPI002F359774
MASSAHDEVQLNKKHEEILGKRAVLLQQMENCYKQQKAKKKQQANMSQTARERNAKILEDCQKLKDRLRTRPLLHPDVLSLQTQYWASVEQKLPEWESYLLGKGPAPVSDASPHEGQNSTKQTSPGRTGSRSSQPKARSPV